MAEHDNVAPITQIGAAVVISGEAVPVLYRAVLALIARRRRDGLAASPLLIEARAVLYRASVSERGHEIARQAPAESSSQCRDGRRISVADAADLLHLGRRQTRRLAANGLGVRLGRSIWALDRSAVLALANERKGRR